MSKIKAGWRGRNKNKSSWRVTLSLLLILFAGIIVASGQIQSKKNIIGNASNNQDIINCDVDQQSLKVSAMEQNLLEQINSYRAQYGLAQLVLSEDLNRAAAWMSNDMLAKSYLNHTDSLGRNFSARIAECGYAGYAVLGENVDSGSDNNSVVFEAWKHSPAHNANLLNPNYTEAGIALSSDPSNGAFYWSMDFGSKLTPLSTTPLPTLVTSPTDIPTPTLIPTATISQGVTPTKKPTLTPVNTPTKGPTELPTKPFTPTATPTPTDIPTPTMPPGFVQNDHDMQIFVLAKIAGIGRDGNRNPKERTKHVSAEIYGSSNKKITGGNGFLIYDGSDMFGGIIHLGPLESGTYYVKILADHMLQTIVRPIFQDLDSSRLNMLTRINLIQGDINDDNIIDINDYNDALDCFQDKKCESADLIDFNSDGSASVIDYNILLHNFWETLGD